MIAVQIPDVLHQPMQDLHTAQVQRQRRHFVARRECLIGPRPQLLHVAQDRPNARSIASAEEPLDPYDRLIDGEASALGSVGENLDYG